MTVTVALPDEATLARLSPAPAGAELVVWRAGDPPLGRRIDLLLPSYGVSYGFLSHLDPAEVGAVQAQSLGYDGVADSLPSGIAFCNAVGVHEAPTAELAVGLTISAQRGLADFARARGAWDRPILPGLAGRSVLLIGVGGVGRAIEQRLIPFEVRLTLVGRSARGDVHTQAELPELLPEADIVILAVPLGPSTTGLVDGAFLDRMRPGALLVNISRGAVVDTDALTEHVRDGRVRAALDVVDPEPLPAEHPLWTLAGATITPHVGGNVSSMSERIDPLIREQVELLLDGKPLKNIVIPA